MSTSFATGAGGHARDGAGRQVCGGFLVHDNPVLELERLPGHELVQEGLRDLEMGRLTIAALLVAIGAPKLRRLGIAVAPSDEPMPEHRLYEALSRDDPDSAHSRYNALLRRLVSFEHAAECASRQT